MHGARLIAAASLLLLLTCIARAQQPQFLGVSDGSVLALARSGGHLWFGAGTRLHIAADSVVTPISLADLNQPGVILGLAASGSQAWMALGSEGVAGAR